MLNFASHSKEWKKFESNNKSIVLNILYVPQRENNDDKSFQYALSVPLNYELIKKYPQRI